MLFYNNMHSGPKVLTSTQQLSALQPASPPLHTETEVSDASCQAEDCPPIRPYRRNLAGRPRPLSLTPFGHRKIAVSPEMPDYVAALPSGSPMQRVCALINSPRRRIQASIETPVFPKKQPVSTPRLQRCLYPRFNPVLPDIEGFNLHTRTRSRWLSMRGSPQFCLLAPLHHRVHRRERTMRQRKPLA